MKTALEQIDHLLKVVPSKNAYIAGGAAITKINNEIPCGDIDIFVVKDHFECLAYFESNGYKPLQYTLNVYTLEHPDWPLKVQLIDKTGVSDITKVLKVFDLRTCAVAYQCQTLELLSNHFDTVSQIKKKILCIEHRKNIFSLLTRIGKYTDKGFTLCGLCAPILIDSIEDPEMLETSFFNYDINQ